MVSRVARLLSFATLLAQFALIWAAFFVLSTSIDWPGSLDDPASIALPRLLLHPGSVALGYACYLLAALLLVPAAAALSARLGAAGLLSELSLGLATLAAFAKTVGIARWLFAMPNLARTFAEPASNRASVELMFDTWNDYAGGIGEVMGVGLFGGSWTILVATRVLAGGERGSRFVGGFALATGLLLVACIPAHFGLAWGPVLTFSNIAWQLSLLGLGIWALRAPEPRLRAGMSVGAADRER